MASLILYPFVTTLTPLLACVSSILQAFVTLQLVFSVNDRDPKTREADVKKEV